MKALTAAEMREVDRLTTERHGISQLQLMETAGNKAADIVWRIVAGRERVRVCVLCGKGNNGGDGFVAARRLKDSGVAVQVILFGRVEDVRGDASANLARWRAAGNEVNLVNEIADWQRLWPTVASATVFVDALLGTGLRGAPTGAIACAITEINNLSRHCTAPTPALILAIDTPSGLPSDGEAAPGPLLTAHRTVTFTAPKIGQLISSNADACGALEVVSIGSPASLAEEIGGSKIRWIDASEFAALPLVRSWNSNKGRYGHVLLVAGSAGKSGAAILASLGALRAGAGLVTAAVPAPIQSILAAAHPEYMTETLETTPDGAIAANNLRSGTFARIAEGKSVLAVGPGLGTAPETREFVSNLVRETSLPLVLDADALNAFAGHANLLRQRRSSFLAVTPHPGEMARLLGCTTAQVEADRVRIAGDAARDWNAHVILKGFHTLVASPDGRIFVNTTGNPGLAKGGTGDVLTGVLSALIAQFAAQFTAEFTAEFTDDAPLRALALGVHLHGLAADLLAARDQDRSGMLAGEVANEIPAARSRLIRELQFGA